MSTEPTTKVPPQNVARMFFLMAKGLSDDAKAVKLGLVIEDCMRQEREKWQGVVQALTEMVRATGMPDETIAAVIQEYRK